MSETIFPLDRFAALSTPFYYYDTPLLRATLQEIKKQLNGKERHHVHYAIKANANPRILSEIKLAGFGADCVSGGEIRAALAKGFSADEIVFAGVGKSDWEIELGLDAGIGCFNVESLPELEVINEIAVSKGKLARIAFRVNPNVDAHTHEKITTGLNENKFGISSDDIVPAIKKCHSLPGVEYIGLHFHIGSQILDLNVYADLCHKINEIQKELEAAGIFTESINVGGGLGIDYEVPDATPIPNFASYFKMIEEHLELRPHQQLHFELGRSIVAQMGTLIARVLYEKVGHTKKFLILDAGMTELIRPAMYQAHHHIQNISAKRNCQVEIYDVVGPICESSDVFAKGVSLPHSKRGDLIAIRSAGAYGETMASTYNCRPLPQTFTTEDLL